MNNLLKYKQKMYNKGKLEKQRQNIRLNKVIKPRMIKYLIFCATISSINECSRQSSTFTLKISIICIYNGLNSSDKQFT